jgi:DNA-directed RNA polymerase subunit omega
MIDPADMREGLVHAMQQNAEIDEPEPAAAPASPRVLHSLGRDDPSTDTVVDVITEHDLLRGMEKFGPLETATKVTEG